MFLALNCCSTIIQSLIFIKYYHFGFIFAHFVTPRKVKIFLFFTTCTTTYYSLEIKIKCSTIIHKFLHNFCIFLAFYINEFWCGVSRLSKSRLWVNVIKYIHFYLLQCYPSMGFQRRGTLNVTRGAKSFI